MTTKFKAEEIEEMLRIADSNIESFAYSHQALVEMVRQLFEENKSLREREEALEAKISEWNEKYRQDIEALQRQLTYFYKSHHPDKIQRIVGIDNSGIAHQLMITKCVRTNDGAFIEVRIPQHKPSTR